MLIHNISVDFLNFKKDQLWSFKIVPNDIAVIFAVIIGAAVFKQIDFQYMTVEKPLLALVYLIGFLISIGFMIKKTTTK